MNTLSSLKSIKSGTSKRRVGRGGGSGKGKTSGRGHKGYKARTGSNSRLRYEGGQMPIISRIPKLKGFKVVNTKNLKVINVGEIAEYAVSGEITKKILVKNGILRKGFNLKILGDGELNEKLNIEADAFTKSAIEKIEKAGGKAIIAVVKKKRRE
ncbi:MAG TPA: 50S ribosomal protein L15 [Patescibacteria group bacterium]|nr:50S ribosomal protein L15 [Patescibacteria group bacterium]